MISPRLIAALIAAPLALAACGGAGAARTETVTATATTTTTITEPAAPALGDTVTADDQTYLAFLASKGVYADPQTSIEVGKSICDALDGGYDVTTIMAVAQSSGFTTDEGAAIIAAAIVTYCPWNEYKVQQ